jgi:transcriptional regulator with XRE-family HTH domain
MTSASQRLGSKLQQIRKSLGLPQHAMIDHLGLREARSYISVWEHGKSEPSRNALLRYAHAAGVSVDALLDDTLNLPCVTSIRQSRRVSEGLTSERLGEKLFQIRDALNLSQNDMIDHLGLREYFDRAYISFWENGKIEPPLYVLRRYASAGGVSLNVLADDAMNFTLPKQIRRDK